MSNRAEVELGFDDKEIAAGIARNEKRFESFGKKIANSGKGGGSGMIGMLSGGALVAGAAATAVALKNIGDEIGHVTDQADKLNTSSEAIQKLTNFADPTGTDIDTVTKALTKLNRALLDGSDPKADNALRELGVSAMELTQLEPDQQILRLNSAFQHAQQSGKGFNEIFALMGKSASELLPILRMDHDELAALQDMHVVSNQDAKNIDALGDKIAALTRVSKAWVATSIMGAIKMHQAMSDAMNVAADGGNFIDAFNKSLESQKAAEDAADKADQKKREQIKTAEAAAAMADKQITLDEMHTQILNSQATAMEKVANLEAELTKFSNSGEAKMGVKKGEIQTLQEFIKLTNELAAARKAAAAEAQRMEGIVKMQRNAKEGLQNETDDLKIQELRQSRRFAAADKLERERKNRMNEQKIRDAHPTMGEAEVKAMAKRQANIDDRARGIIGKTVAHESATAWGLHAAPKASALDALKGRLDLNAKMGETHLKNKLVGNRPGNDPKPEVKLTDGEMMIQKLDGVIAAVKEITAY